MVFFKGLFLSAHWTIMMEKSVFFKITLSKSLSLISDECCFYFLEVLYTSKLSFYFAAESLQEVLRDPPMQLPIINKNHL